MASLPSYVTLLFEGFAEQHESGVLRTDMEVGPPKQARVRSRTMVTRSVVLLLKSKANYSAFITWYRDTIHHGADWFDWRDPVSGTTKQIRFVGGALSAQPQNPTLSIWKISASVEGWGI